MAKTRKLEIIIAGDASGLNKALGQVDTFGSKMSSKMRTVGKGVGLAFGGALAVAGKLGLDALGEAREAERVGRLTDAVIKSTGAAANVSAGQVAKLAEAISNKTGIDDEQIQSGQNLLLTFTKIRNEVGAGNDIFDQATMAATNLSAALGTDMKSASLQVGKALNDPVKGVGALTRAGVSFTQQQKDQIKAMVEAGDTLGAQKLILKELGTQFGGAAEAAADPMQKLGTVVNNLKERVGTALLPAVSKAASWLGEHLPAALDRAESMFARVKAWVETNWPKVRDVVVQVVGKIAGYVRPVLAALQTAWKVFGDNVVRQVRNAFVLVRSVFSAALDVIRGVFRVFAGLFTGDWSRLWSGVKDIFGGIWGAVGALFRFGLETLKNAAGASLDAIVGLFGGLGRRLGDAMVGVASAITAPLRSAWNALADLWNSGPGSWSFTIPSWVPIPGLRGKTFDMPDAPRIPTFHTGGIVPGRGDVPAMLLGGEGVIRPSTVQALAGDLFGRRATLGGGGTTVNVYVAGNLVHEQQLERYLADHVLASGRRGGQLAAAIRKVS